MEHLAPIQYSEHAVHETDYGYYNDIVFMVVLTTVTMIFIIIINLGCSQGREQQLTNVGTGTRAC